MQVNESVKIQELLSTLHIDEWLRGDVFHWRWWALLAMLVLSPAVWWLLVDKSRLREAGLFALLMMIPVLAVDEYGEELILWDYPIDILPVFPPLTSINLLILPLTYSLIYQRFRTTKSYVCAAAIATAALCFILEPALAWGGFYQLVNWRHYWSYPVYLAMAAVVRLLTMKIIRITDRSPRAGGGR